MGGGIQRTCPACGLESDEIRCPRCNALKVVGCTGACTVCKSSCKPEPLEPGSRPSDQAPDDDEMVGTPLER